MYVKKKTQSGGAKWKSVEIRVQEELALEHLKVDIVVGDDEQEEEPALRAAASGAKAAFSLDKVSMREFRLLLFASKRGERSAFFKEIPIIVPRDVGKKDVAQVVSLKVAEAVNAAVHVEAPSETGPEPEPRHITIDIKPRKIVLLPPPPLKKMKQWAMASLISGVVVVSVAGVLHSQKITYEKTANKFAGMSKGDEAPPRYSQAYRDLHAKYRSNSKQSTAYRRGAIAAYSVGGTLIAAGITVGLVAVFKHRGQEHKRHAVAPTGAGVMVEF